MTWVDDVVSELRVELAARADPTSAPQMQAYMKGVAPFLGLQTPERRRVTSAVARQFAPPPDEGAIAELARALFALPEREFAYAACDLLTRWMKHCGPDFLVDPVQELLVTRPWWDTVDSLGSAAVSPLCRRYDELRSVVLDWSASGELWLERAAIQHQRGWGEATDVPFVLSLCADHADDREFFIQKAIGWALRDLSPLDPAAVRAFVDAHPELTRVATREAERGLDRLT
jgi:3-methyladenine DNA glycosylase AlkD